MRLVCRKTYSSTYTASGEEQIVHYYSENRDRNRGYPAVFDARMDDLGKVLLDAPVSGKFTIGECFIEVRPRVGRKATAKKRVQ